MVISTAGPFAQHGSLLVSLCAAHGTDYCDITGESDWVREMIDLYDDSARKSGARLVHHCGHDCVPWDLVVLECAKQLKQRGETLTGGWGWPVGCCLLAGVLGSVGLCLLWLVVVA